MRIGRVRLRANVLDANVAVVDRLVDKSEIGAALARPRGKVAEDEACRESRADDEGGDASQCEKVACAEPERVVFRLERTECGAMLYV